MGIGYQIEHILDGGKVVFNVTRSVTTVFSKGQHITAKGKGVALKCSQYSDLRPLHGQTKISLDL